MNAKKTSITIALFALFATGLVTYIAATSSVGRAQSAPRFAAIDDLFSPQLKHGWTILSAPDDSKTYRTCGVAYSAPLLAGRTWTPKFRSDSGILECPVEIPVDKVVSVVCLQQKDDPSLCYAVLVRDFMEHEFATLHNGG